MRTVLSLSALAVAAGVGGWFGFVGGVMKGVDVGRAEVAVYQMRLHPRTAIELPPGRYDVAAAGMHKGEVLYRDGTASWVPAQ